MATRKSSLVRKFTIICAAILLIVLFALSFQMYTAYQLILDRTVNALSVAHQQTRASIEYFGQTLENAAFALCYSPTVQQLLKTDASIGRVLLNDDLNSVFSSTSLLQGNIIGISVFDKDGGLITSNGQAVLINHMNVSEIAAHPEGLFSALSSKTEETRLGRKTYTIAYPIYYLQTNRLLGGLVGGVLFTMSTGNMQDILANIESFDGGLSILADAQGQMVAGSSPAAQALFDSGKWRDDPTYLAITSTLEGSGWTLTSLIPKGQVQSDLLPILWGASITGAAIVLLLACVMLLLYSKVFTPIRRLSGFMQAVPSSESGARYPLGGSGDELALMAASMNGMLDSLDEKNIELRQREKQYLEADIARQEMEIIAYRNQISPHFLYNTLECIRGIALYRSAPEIVAISQSLSKMFRYTVKGGNFASAADEVNHTREYATIIGYRFMNRIRVDFDVEEEAMGCRALKLTLQPLVENAVFHGLEKSVSEGVIRVQVCVRRERLIFTVSDNGVGMVPERLQALLDSLTGTLDAANGGEKSIGLGNIARRLKLFYREASTIHIESRQNEGTRVQISIPAQKEADAECIQPSSLTTSPGSPMGLPT